MSSTRRASENSRFRQKKYASSAEFELGLNAVLVAEGVVSSLTTKKSN